MVNSRVQYHVDILCLSQSREEADTLRRKFYNEFKGTLSKEDVQYVYNKVQATCGTPYSRQGDPLLNEIAMILSVVDKMGKD